MMTINPERMPVQIYRFDDKGAPQLDRNGGCLLTIFKACLATGYGEKPSAGWDLAFEDNDNGIKVLCPPIGAQKHFYLRLSDDNGRDALVQVYTDMTDANTGDLKLQCDYKFQYGIGEQTSNKWMLIASARSFWFFHQTGNRAIANNGAFLYCGDTCQNSRGERALYLKHSGGYWGIDDHDKYSIYNVGSGGALNGKLLDRQGAVHNANPTSIFDGTKSYSTYNVFAPLLIIADGEVYPLPAYSPSAMGKQNYDIINDGKQSYINHSTSTHSAHCLFVPMDFWWF